MREKMLPAAEAFVDAMRALFREDMDELTRWTAARELHRILIADPDLKAHAASWPESQVAYSKASNLLFYEDPDYGFVINALIKAPNARTTVHDHGRSWTLYGVLEGRETVLRYERTDGGPEIAETAALKPVGETEVTPGYIDFVPPWEIHEECNGPQRTVGVIIRSQRSGTFVQNSFDLETGRVVQNGGPEQVPYHLG